MSTSKIIGKVAILPKGVWSSSSAYSKLDLVSNSGNSYLAIQDVPVGTAITTSSYWMKIASKGDSAPSSLVTPAVTSWLDQNVGSAIMSSTIALASIPAFSSENTYNINDSVSYEDELYICSTSVTTPGEWTGSANWDEAQFNSIIDKSLTVSGAAADAKVVGDNAILFQRNLTASDNIDNLLTPGMYYKTADSTDTTNPSLQGTLPSTGNRRARIVVFAGHETSPTAGYAVVQLWFDTYNKFLYFRSHNNYDSAWSSWKMAGHTARTLVTTKGSKDNMNLLTEAGIYYKNGGGYTVDNGPADVAGNMARIVVFSSSPESEHAVAQLWFDCPNEKLFFRSRGLSSSSWQSWQQIGNEAEIAQLQTDLINATTYSFDDSTFGWSMGGVNIDGYNNSKTTRLRLLGPDGKSGIFVKAGSTITANIGYKFNVILYDFYASFRQFHKIGARSMGIGSYTIPQDCYIKVSIGTTTDATLWEFDPEQSKATLTEAGTTAESNALTLNLIDLDIKTKLDKTASIIDSLTNGVMELKDELPTTSNIYYELWNDMIDDNFVTKETIGYTEAMTVWQDTNHDLKVEYPALPINMYTIYSDMTHMKPGYGRQQWDADHTNQLYDRPKILLIGGQHGNERTSPSVLLNFALNLWLNPDYQELRDGFYWYIIPLMNPWGYSHSLFLNYELNNGSGYTYPMFNEDTNRYEFDGIIQLNTSSVHQGIRKNIRGDDINRAFGDRQTLLVVNHENGYSGTISSIDVKGLKVGKNKLINDRLVINGQSVTIIGNSDNTTLPTEQTEFTIYFSATDFGTILNEDQITVINQFIPEADTFMEKLTNLTDLSLKINKTNGYSGAINSIKVKGKIVEENQLINHELVINGQSVIITGNTMAITGDKTFTINFNSTNFGTITNSSTVIVKGADKFTLIMDCHQARGGGDVLTDENAWAAFVSLSTDATIQKRHLIYNTFMQAAAKSMLALANWLNKNNDIQTMYPWEGSDLPTLRNYCGNYADYSLCYEGGQNCTYYSNLTGRTNWSNEISRAVMNTQFHNFISILLKKWM